MSYTEKIEREYQFLQMFKIFFGSYLVLRQI